MGSGNTRGIWRHHMRLKMHHHVLCIYYHTTWFKRCSFYSIVEKLLFQITKYHRLKITRHRPINPFKDYILPENHQFCKTFCTYSTNAFPTEKTHTFEAFLVSAGTSPALFTSFFLTVSLHQPRCDAETSTIWKWQQNCGQNDRLFTLRSTPCRTLLLLRSSFAARLSMWMFCFTIQGESMKFYCTKKQHTAYLILLHKNQHYWLKTSFYCRFARHYVRDFFIHRKTQKKILSNYSL